MQHLCNTFKTFLFILTILRKMQNFDETNNFYNKTITVRNSLIIREIKFSIFWNYDLRIIGFPIGQRRRKPIELIELTFPLEWNCRGCMDGIVLDDAAGIPLKVGAELSPSISHSEFLAIERSSCNSKVHREFPLFLLRAKIVNDFPFVSFPFIVHREEFRKLTNY